MVLLQAHQALEALTLTKDQARFKARVSQEYADLIYNGLWFTAHHQNLAAYVQSTQRHVTGKIRVRLNKGSSVVVGRESAASLYQLGLSTYGKEDAFDHKASVGFIHIFGLPVKIQAQTQLLKQPGDALRLAGPKDE